MIEIPSPEEVARRRELGLSLQKRNSASDFVKSKFAVLSSFSMDLFPPFLIEALDRGGLPIEVYVGQIGQISQELLDPDSSLYAADPERVVVIPAIEDVLGPLFDQSSVLSPEEMDSLVNQWVVQMEQALLALLARLPKCTCYLVIFGSHRVPVEHILEPQSTERGQAAIERISGILRNLGSLSPRVVLVDWDWHCRANGRAAFHDQRLWYLGRMRLNPAGLASMAELISRCVSAYQESPRKIAVVDLDNTLWGGVVGETGISGITLGEEGLGLAFQDVQRELLALNRSGVLLGICSKNNPDDVWEVFDQHPGMILKREHFSTFRINWQDKATNLLEMAEELGLGVDSFVFLDDNPVERDWVRTAIPEVAVPDLPSDPAYVPEFLRRTTFFQRIMLTDADSQRVESYRTLGLRQNLKVRAATLDEFLTSLEQEVSIELVNQGSIARASQMCQRTNQFNLTTWRYTVADLENMTKDPSTEAYTLAVKDRFGDSGITGLSVLRFEAGNAEIDTFLMSCRILGRRIEDMFIRFLAERAIARGARYLLGRYISTTKNDQVALFYPDRGFDTISDGIFRLDLNGSIDPQFQVLAKVATDA